MSEADELITEFNKRPPEWKSMRFWHLASLEGHSQQLELNSSNIVESNLPSGSCATFG